MPSMSEHPVLEVYEDLARLVRSKAHDYADDGNVYSNFEGAAQLANVSVDTVFHVMVGIKMERLRQLMSGKTPNHEGIEDTLKDAANYLSLWLGYRNTHPEQLELDIGSSSGYTVPQDSITGAPI